MPANTTSQMPQIDPDAPVYVISVAAQISGLHPQTLRQYDRLGLVTPDRTSGRNRLYSLADIDRLRRIQDLAADGINLTGIERILELEAELEQLRARLDELEQQRSSTALMVWRPRR